jgi:hypothetical protein
LTRVFPLQRLWDQNLASMAGQNDPAVTAAAGSLPQKDRVGPKTSGRGGHGRRLMDRWRWRRHGTRTGVRRRSVARTRRDDSARCAVRIVTSILRFMANFPLLDYAPSGERCNCHKARRAR